MIEFGTQQKAALDLIVKWRKSEYQRPFVLNGYAGTGKTTIAKSLPEMLGVQPEAVIYAAYTGKAALQLRKKGCDDATTLHRLLYMPLEKSRQRLEAITEQYENLVKNKAPKAQLNELQDQLLRERDNVVKPSWSLNPDTARLSSAKVIVVDESSMVDEKLHADLIETGVPIIYCGDPFQLPPVAGKSPVTQMPVNITLTDVHRQALGNPILKLATDMREGVPLDLTPRRIENEVGESLEFIRMRDTSYEFFNSHDQVLCGKNATRHDINRRMRAKAMEYGTSEKTKNPIGTGDRVVFLRNDYDAEMFNGTLGHVSCAFDYEDDHTVFINGTTDEGKFSAYEVWAGKILSKHDAEAPRFMQRIDLAYALTVHKAQGSEWDSVLVQHEPFGTDEERARWTYTALTRSRKRCSIVTTRG